MDAKLETRVPATVRRLLLAGTVLMLLAGCQGADDSLHSQQMTWAKAALERNPNLEIVATDDSAESFAGRDRRTREIQTVQLDELAAAPIAQAPLSGEYGPRSGLPMFFVEAVIARAGSPVKPYPFLLKHCTGFVAIRRGIGTSLLLPPSSS